MKIRSHYFISYKIIFRTFFTNRPNINTSSILTTNSERKKTHNCVNASSRPKDLIFDLSLSDAIAILEAPGRVSTKGKEIGKHPNDDKPIVLKKGKFGNYITYKSKNYSLPKDLDEKNLTLEKSIEIIKEKIKTKKKK